ncbi:MAG: psd [Chlamydiales bacterium]|jgi:phosphatidylserine decarboxylase|nr:psd [Chlamydiales bacterium]
MTPISYIDRQSGQVEEEKIYGGRWMAFCYGDSLLSRTIGRLVLHLFIKTAAFSKFYGKIQDFSWTRRKIIPFIRSFNVKVEEFEKKVESFTSFNDFFYRKLKKEARPIEADPNVAVMPADGRYLAFQHISAVDEFFVKGDKFNLETFLQSKELAKEYEGGSLLLARLCPSDCHRYFFPHDCTPSTPKLINGKLFSVNPMAFVQNLKPFLQNKRYLTELDSPQFGKVLYVEVGATCVGAVHQTYEPGQSYEKGEEKGYFSFGGSSLFLLYKKDQIAFHPDLLENTSIEKRETYCQMGGVLGTAVSALSEA